MLAFKSEYESKFGVVHVLKRKLTLTFSILTLAFSIPNFIVRFNLCPDIKI